MLRAAADNLRRTEDGGRKTEDGGRRASGLALGNLKVVFRRVVRAASGLALGNLGVVFRRVVRATEDGRRKKNVRQPSGTVTCLLLRGGDTVFEHL